MTGLLGAFVLLLVGVMAAQLDMASQLEVEVQKRQIEEQNACRSKTPGHPAGQRPHHPEQRSHWHQRQTAVQAQLRPARTRRPPAAQKPGAAVAQLPANA
jgi:hypothetical protein